MVLKNYFFFFGMYVLKYRETLTRVRRELIYAAKRSNWIRNIKSPARRSGIAKNAVRED